MTLTSQSGSKQFLVKDNFTIKAQGVRLNKTFMSSLNSFSRTGSFEEEKHAADGLMLKQGQTVAVQLDWATWNEVCAALGRNLGHDDTAAYTGCFLDKEGRAHDVDSEGLTRMGLARKVFSREGKMIGLVAIAKEGEWIVVHEGDLYVTAANPQALIMVLDVKAARRDAGK